MKKKRRPPAILLDTNVWRYISDADFGDELRRHALRHRVQIQIAPSVLYEALRAKDAQLRNRLVELMTRPYWTRLMPEAHSESMEVSREIQRLHPEWLRREPDRTYLRRLLYDWQRPHGGFWDRARHSPEAEAGFVSQLEEGTVEAARSQIEQARRVAREGQFRFENVRLNELLATPGFAIPGYDGNQVEPWRLTSLVHMSTCLAAAGHAYVDWLSSEIDLQQALSSGSSWARFWLYEVDEKNLPRQWLRWAFELLQSLRKITDGTPCDIQLATYLVEADNFVSADKALTQVIEKCRPHSPARIADVVAVPAGNGALDALIKLLAST